MFPRATILAALLGVLSVFALGYWAGSGQVETKTIERVVYQERQEDVKAARDETRHTTRERTVTKPDGTQITSRSIQVERKAEQFIHSKREKAQTTQRVVQADSRKTNYRLSVQVKPTDTSDVRVGLGRRLLGPIWGEATVRPKTREFTLGLGVEF